MSLAADLRALLGELGPKVEAYLDMPTIYVTATGVESIAVLEDLAEFNVTVNAALLELANDLAAEKNSRAFWSDRARERRIENLELATRCSKAEAERDHAESERKEAEESWCVQRDRAVKSEAERDELQAMLDDGREAYRRFYFIEPNADEMTAYESRRRRVHEQEEGK